MLSLNHKISCNHFKAMKKQSTILREIAHYILETFQFAAAFSWESHILVTDRRQLTNKPPPAIPPKYFTSSVRCPSLTYLTFQSGKNNMVLQMMEMSTNGYRVPAMQREHFPLHMLSEWKLTVKPLVQYVLARILPVFRDVPLHLINIEKCVFIDSWTS